MSASETNHEAVAMDASRNINGAAHLRRTRMSGDIAGVWGVLLPNSGGLGNAVKSPKLASFLELTPIGHSPIVKHISETRCSIMATQTIPQPYLSIISSIPLNASFSSSSLLIGHHCCRLSPKNSLKVTYPGFLRKLLKSAVISGLNLLLYIIFFSNLANQILNAIPY